MPTVTGDRHVSADECVRMHKAEWYRGRSGFRLCSKIAAERKLFCLDRFAVCAARR